MSRPADRLIAELETTIRSAKSFFEATDLLNANSNLDSGVRESLGRAFSAWAVHFIRSRSAKHTAYARFGQSNAAHLARYL